MRVGKHIKQTLMRTLLVPGVARSFTPLTRHRAAIFMLHRFRCPDLGLRGHDPADLRRFLAYLRRHRYHLLSLGEVFRRLSGDGPTLRRAVAFTIDDGYFDHAEIGGAVFAEFDCPVTTFATTGFLDGTLWFWWDQIEHIFRETRRHQLETTLNDAVVRYEWQSEAGRNACQDDFTVTCKALPNERKLEAITHLAAAAEVDLPPVAPPRYAPMGWDRVRQCERRGMTFGPHTITHPILARTSDAQSHRELTGSWKRLSEEATDPVPIFCYPNGRFQDFGPREITTLRGMNMMGAVVGAPGGGPSAEAFRRDADARFRVRRYPYSGDLPQLVRYVSGVDRFQRIVRRQHPA